MDGVTAGYGQGKEAVLEDFSFELKRGERVFLHGENGSGKSTLIKAVLAAGGRRRRQRRGTQGSVGGDHRGGRPQDLLCEPGYRILRGRIQEFCRDRGLDESLFAPFSGSWTWSVSSFPKIWKNFQRDRRKSASGGKPHDAGPCLYLGRTFKLY